MLIQPTHVQVVEAVLPGDMSFLSFNPGDSDQLCIGGASGLYFWRVDNLVDNWVRSRLRGLKHYIQRLKGSFIGPTCVVGATPPLEPRMQYKPNNTRAGVVTVVGHGLTR